VQRQITYITGLYNTDSNLIQDKSAINLHFSNFPTQHKFMNNEKCADTQMFLQHFIDFNKRSFLSLENNRLV